MKIHSYKVNRNVDNIKLTYFTGSMLILCGIRLIIACFSNSDLIAIDGTGFII